MDSKLLLSIARQAWALARKAYKADRANRYELKEPWVLPLLNLDIQRYDGPYIRVDIVTGRARVTVKPYSGDICDGATFAPDNVAGVLPAAIFHDPWYVEIPAMAAAWGWTEERVRAAGDTILATIIQRAGGKRLTARVYYNAVYHLGGLFRRIKHKLPFALIAAAFLGLAGCSSCIAPPDISDPDSPYTPPTYEHVQKGPTK